MTTQTEIRQKRPWPVQKRRTSALSDLWRKIDDAFRPGPETWAMDMEGEEEQFMFRVASDRETREKAYRLAYNVYNASGLVSENPSGMVISPYDASFQTVTVLAEDEEGNAAGTFTLILDSAGGLPCDEIYREELRPFRQRGRHLVEVTRLAVAEEHKNAKMLLVTLFDFLSVFSRRIWKATDLVIEVNPRHRKYYERMLLFEEIGGLKSCGRVNGFPAVLMRLDLYLQEEEVREVAGTDGRGRSVYGKTLYSYYHPIEEEYAIAEFLSEHFSPMSIREAGYFGIDRYLSLQKNIEKNVQTRLHTA